MLAARAVLRLAVESGLVALVLLPFELPAGKEASRKVNITGIQLKIFCWMGSGCCGLSCIWIHIVIPIRSGQTPIAGM